MGGGGLKWSPSPVIAAGAGAVNVHPPVRLHSR
ncbi:hypothetical protein Amir_1876 [Actinosynnema mirum DSM 43827]|uniref:Uncharacterized protein n=1 Tax=Actinosynnema mirum (strain ATCC 29888 / DSM 43827 / JCM 3225 / NBRC 14064 / NCIMB 13271 / NRRL B-12336 / IMRU 3971 / 101) TaxID=446462 RepID=C6WE81_ACTMD|nr:hypothetical protein Amir_1876 [Actinosynnema mirum DSM 43827]